MNELELLNKVIESLNSIPVSGKEHCGKMFDSIYALECIRNAHLQAQVEPVKEPQAEEAEKTEKAE